MIPARVRLAKTVTRAVTDALWAFLLRLPLMKQSVPRAAVVTTTLLAVVLGGGVAHAHGKKKPPPRRIDITVTADGFTPKAIRVKKGEEVVLVFKRTTDSTCAKEVIVYLDDGKKIEKKLPLNVSVAIVVTFAKTGELGYTCAMQHKAGVIRVE